MIITVTGECQPQDRQVEILKWCARNGFSATDLVPPCWVDTTDGTIKMNKVRPVAGQEDADFPELQVNENGMPLTTEVLVPLQVAPPAWLATEGMEKTSRQGAASRGSSLTC